ncbi:Conserved_hypothetical protein [Hexamita inflata]|uniref:Uncharacterized protein n=1 Tax=Hexamita inflata TaxID=28002 RepID=A0ABP1GGN0_9EUKA
MRFKCPGALLCSTRVLRRTMLDGVFRRFRPTNARLPEFVLHLLLNAAATRTHNSVSRLHQTTPVDSDAGLCCARCERRVFSDPGPVRVPARQRASVLHHECLPTAARASASIRVRRRWIILRPEVLAPARPASRFRKTPCAWKGANRRVHRRRNQPELRPGCTGMYILNLRAEARVHHGDCPPEAPYYGPGRCRQSSQVLERLYEPSRRRSELVCAASCPIYLVNASSDNSRQCVSKCETPLLLRRGVLRRTMLDGGVFRRFPVITNARLPGFVHLLRAAERLQRENSQQCLAACTDDLPYSDAGLCCAGARKTRILSRSSVRVCQDACPAFFITNASNGNSLQCVDPCPPPMVSVGQECFGACSSGLPFLENAVCVERCQTGAYTDDGTNLNCGPACTGMYILNTSNGNSQKCITACPPETPYYEPGACLVKCSSGFYDLHPGAVQELVCAASCPIYLVNASSDNSKQCVSKCPDAAPYSDAGSCVERCSTAAYSVVSGQQTLVCQDSCTFYVLNATNANSQQCVISCPNNSININNFCQYKCQNENEQNCVNCTLNSNAVLDICQKQTSSYTPVIIGAVVGSVLLIIAIVLITKCYSNRKNKLYTNIQLEKNNNQLQTYTSKQLKQVKVVQQKNLTPLIIPEKKHIKQRNIIKMIKNSDITGI